MHDPRQPASARRRPLGRGRRIAFAAVTLVFMAGVLLGALELFLRAADLRAGMVFHPAPEGYMRLDAEAGYVFAPNYPPHLRRYFDGENQTLLYTNSLGMRDVEPPPPDGRRRILTLGCSVTEGVGLAEPEAPWPRQLERLWREKAGGAEPPVVVMNGAALGYNTFQQVARARQLQPHVRADVWLMGWLDGQNGMWVRNLFGAQGQFVYRLGFIWDRKYWDCFAGGRSEWTLWLVQHSALVRFILFRAADWSDCPDPAGPYGMDLRAASRDALERFRAATDEAGVEPWIVILPAPADLERWRQAPRGDAAEQVAAICADLGLPCVDATPAIQARLADATAQSGKGVIGLWALSEYDQQHYNPAGHRMLAEVIDALIPLGPAARRDE
ncbi:MAG TPA: hypothetical protein PLS90_08610 [Candidatus Sumerlaeota bacterium]|nr:hypothetical protein [Candidatus Sumerlaeota bacterium]